MPGISRHIKERAEQLSVFVVFVVLVAAVLLVIGVLFIYPIVLFVLLLIGVAVLAFFVFDKWESAKRKREALRPQREAKRARRIEMQKKETARKRDHVEQAKTAVASGDLKIAHQNLAGVEEIFRRSEPYLKGIADAIAVVDRAQHAIGVAAAVADVNSRLGTQVSEIETVMTYCCRTDTDQETGKQFPVMFLHETVLSYLRIHPSNQDLLIALVLGIWVDPHLGPIPVLFIWTSKMNQQRMVAAIWPGVKCNTADLAVQLSAFRGLERDSELIHSSDRGAEGGLQRISDITIYVQGKDGLDLKMESHYVPFKLWNSLMESVVLHAVSKTLVDTAKPWPYPSQIGGGIVKKTYGAADFKLWY